jgi:hypothetical protein
MQKSRTLKAKTDQLWGILRKYNEWNSLMGCSIQPNAKDNTKPEVS